MKFLYHPLLRIKLWNYGIEIPIRDSRVTKSWEYLNNHPRFNPDILLAPPETFLTKEDFLRVHQQDYIDRLFETRTEEELIKVYELIDEKGEYNRYNPQKSQGSLKELLQEAVRMATGTYHAAKEALQEGFVFYFGGGMHHGHYDHGSGFCPVNDILTAARKLQAEKKASLIWIIDVDAHKGDGTAAITQEDDTIRTLSIHMAEGWPLDDQGDTSQNPAYLPSDVDIPIHSGEESEYNQRLKAGLETLAAQGLPDLAIVVDGSDPFKEDELPSTQSLNMELPQLLERDQLVYSFLQDRGIPTAFLMAGGYGESSWKVYSQFFGWLLES